MDCGLRYSVWEQQHFITHTTSQVVTGCGKPEAAENATETRTHRVLVFALFFFQKRIQVEIKIHPELPKVVFNPNLRRLAVIDKHLP